MNILDIQSYWEIPSIAQFCSVFRKAFKLPVFDIEDLEEALLADGTDGQPALLPELIVKLLIGCNRKWKNECTTSNYQMFLRRKFRTTCKNLNIENTFDSDVDFQSLPLRTKTLNLHLLCEIRLRIGYDIVNRIDPDTLRVQPLGSDADHSTYWYFYGTRLYREDKITTHRVARNHIEDPSDGNSVWQVVCFTEDDWHRLAAKFKHSRNPNEQAFKNTLTDFLPTLRPVFRDRELQRRLKLIPLRTSSRLNVKQLNREAAVKTVAGESSNSGASAVEDRSRYNATDQSNGQANAETNENSSKSTKRSRSNSAQSI